MRRLYLHVGMMKTGTTFLQGVWRANHRELARQHIFYPAGPKAPVQAFAVWDLVGRRPRGTSDERISGQWAALTDVVSRNLADTALLSVESLAHATVREARRVVAGFPNHEVHVLVTARDLGRVLASAWQESVKNGATETWPQFVSAIRDPTASARDPARGFWLRHDLPTVLDTWSAAVGIERVHLVTVPPSGSAPTMLLERVGQVVGFDPDRLTRPPRSANESLGAAATEVVRRLNEHLGNRINQRQYDRVVKLVLQPRLPAAGSSERFAIPVEHEEWAAAQAQRMITHARDNGYAIAGATADIHTITTAGTTAGIGPAPDDVSDAAVLEASVQCLAVIAQEYANLWWEHRPIETARVPSTSLAGRAASRVRSGAFRTRRSAAELADRNPVAAKAMGAYLWARRAGSRRS